MDEKPGLLIIASSQAITQASQYITDDAISTLQKMDFLQSFALIAFNGLKPTLHYDFKIQKIIKNKDQIYVFVQPSQAGLQEVISSLYHLISIKKEDEWGQTFVFHLYIVDGSEDLSTVVVQERPSPWTLDAYSGVILPTSGVRVPIVQKNNNSLYSDLLIQNSGGVVMQGDLAFMPSTGTAHTYTNFATVQGANFNGKFGRDWHHLCRFGADQQRPKPTNGGGFNPV